jgi:hypothetical protein
MLKLTLALIFMSAVPYCNKCINNGDSCADSFDFNVVDKTTGQNLVFGSSPVYDADSVYLTTTLQGYLGKMSYAQNNKFQSALLIPVDVFYLRFSATDTDTLIMQYNFAKSNCCANGQYGRVRSIQYNGVEADKVNDVFIFKK